MLVSVKRFRNIVLLIKKIKFNYSRVESLKLLSYDLQYSTPTRYYCHCMIHNYDVIFQPEKQLSHLARVLRVIPESSNQLEKAVRHFYKRIFNIKPSSTEMGILVALSLFSADRGTHLSEKRKIEDFQVPDS